eukprot:206349_1
MNMMNKDMTKKKRIWRYRMTNQRSETQSGDSRDRQVFLEQLQVHANEQESEFDTSDDDVVTSNKYANLPVGSVFNFNERPLSPEVAKSDFERHYVSQVMDEITQFPQSRDGSMLSPRSREPVIERIMNEDIFDPYQVHPPNVLVDAPNPYQYQYEAQEALPQQDESDNPS